MSTSRHAKRQKLGRIHYTRTYRDSIPVHGDFDIIHPSEGTAQNRGGSSYSTRRHQHPPQAVAGIWEAISGWSPPDDRELALDPNGDQYDEVIDAGVMDDPQALPAKKKKKRSVVSQRPTVVWRDLYRQTYLNEILRWVGRGDFLSATHCSDCLSRRVDVPKIPEYRCKECFSPDLTCQACCLKRHRNHPLHRIQRWTGESFEDVSLRTLGLRVQLNHSSGRCDNPVPCHANMLVLHVNGIHSVNINYCGCSRSIPHHVQLLRRRLYPASQISVKTCASFELLRQLHKLALTTKASTYDFYRCLELLTTSRGFDAPKSRYRALSRIIVQWRHLQMLKWAGRGHDISGVEGTSPGELAIKCPTCPYPGINIPDDWASAPEELKYLYRAMVSLDANFRLKSQLVSNYSQDPGLGPGWAYMIPRELYEAYVLSRASDEDISTCVGFQALAKANTKFSRGLRYTGVGMAVCARSEMVMPLGIGNLQKGERYANMDYIFGMVLQSFLVTMVLISYDIACQWFKKLSARMEEDWPPEIRPNTPNQVLTPAIPKLHEQMHRETNHQVYSLNYIPGVGHTDGECIERVWGPHNILGNSTKTQGPGNRQNTLDDHFGFWNWLKYISTGATLLRRYKSAVAERNIQQEAHRGLTASLDAEVVKKWERMCQEWDQAVYPKTCKNPYHSPRSTLSEAQVKKTLAESEAAYLAEGGLFPHTTTVSAFVTLGLEIEDSQRRLRRLAKSSANNRTMRMEGALIEQRNLLSTRIRAWELLLPIYVPGLLQYQTDNPESARPSENAEESKLWLPSVIPQPHRSRISLPSLIETELQLRLAQMNDALSAVRQILRIKSRMVLFKNRNIRGQRDGTRSRAVIDRVHERARAAASKYRDARTAYLALSGPGEWENTLKVLDDADIRGYQDANRLRVRVGRRGTFEDDHSQAPVDDETPPEDLSLFNEARTRRDGTGETRRTLSWIWMVGSIDYTKDGDDDELLRVEWAKSRSRALRGNEEVLMLKEEMRRGLAFLEWKARWWKEREKSRPDVSKELLEAISAYSITQAKTQESLASHFRNIWQAPLTMDDIINDSESDDESSDDNDDDDAGDEEDQVSGV